MTDMAGKAENKATLQRMLGLNEEANTPIVAIVSRLVSHKGLDLICEVLRDMMELPLQLVLLGKGDQKYEEFFHWAQQQYPGRMAVRLDYNEPLSMAIYSGADLFLMPSKSEPCGLSQMIAMRYGTVPIVRETGGLRDSVQPYDDTLDVGTGFTFANYSSADMLYVIRGAVELYHNDPAAFARLRDRAMSGDFSWTRSAKEYLNIYTHITTPPAPIEEPVEEVVEAAPVVEEKPKRTRKTTKKADEAAVEGEEKPKRTRKTTKKAAAETEAVVVEETEKKGPAEETAE
jgi:starch synthase